MSTPPKEIHVDLCIECRRKLMDATGTGVAPVFFSARQAVALAEHILEMADPMTARLKGRKRESVAWAWRLIGTALGAAAGSTPILVLERLQRIEAAAKVTPRKKRRAS